MRSGQGGRDHHWQSTASGVLGDVGRGLSAIRLGLWCPDAHRSVRRLTPSCLVVAPTVAEWTWRDADVIWLDKLDPSTLSCLLDGRAPGTPGVWTAHQARGFYLPPIGAKMEMPVIWQFHEHRSCAGEKFEYGGNRAAPTEEDDAGWAEVFHYNRPLNDRFESAHVWLYRARGTGVFYRMGRTITFHDTIDLSHYLSSKFNVLSSVKGFGKVSGLCRAL